MCSVRADAVLLWRGHRHLHSTVPSRVSSVPVKAYMLTDDQIRDALTHLHDPLRLDKPETRELLEMYGRMPSNPTKVAVGEAVASLLVEKIEAIRPPGNARPPLRLPYLVLKTCFVHGKNPDAADELGLSERQLTRERASAIAVLRDELALVPLRLQVPPEHFPDTTNFVARPPVMDRLRTAVSDHRRVAVTGGADVGKTSLVAMFVREANFESVFWLTFRQGLNVSLAGFLWELANYLSRERKATLAEYLTESLPRPDMGIATRLALQALDDRSRRLLVLDGYQLAEKAAEVSAFVDEIVARIDRVRVITIGTANPHAPVVEVPPLFPRPPKPRHKDGV